MKSKLLIIIALIICCFTNSYSQSDWWGYTYEDKTQYHVVYINQLRNNTLWIQLQYVGINPTKNRTYVQFSIYKVGGQNAIRISPSSKMNLSLSNGWKLPLIGVYIDDYTIISAADHQKSSNGYSPINDYEKVNYSMVFNGIIPHDGSLSFDITDPGEINYLYRESNNHEVKWPSINNVKWITFNNDDFERNQLYGFKFRTDWTEEKIKQFADTHNDGICGIYVSQYTDYLILGCIKEDDVYKLIYLGCDNGGYRERLRHWQVGDVKAILHPKYVNPNEFDADWIFEEQYIQKGQTVSFGTALGDMYVKAYTSYPRRSTSSVYKKVYPASSGSNISGGNNKNNNSGSNSPDNFAGGWSGSGFALNNGYLATNYHVIEGASVIKVFGVKGNFNIGYNAQVVITDKVNDLAVLKINDNRFQGFGAIPYRVKTTMAEVGESVFVLGYPLTTTMGSEVKLTTGVISARSGFQGDVSLYQVSAPIQPGNSGGPCFDNSGNLVGIINSKHRGAENVSYAIKSSYLQNLVESSDVSGLLPQNNTISSYTLQGKVKSVKNFVYYIRCK